MGGDPSLPLDGYRAVIALDEPLRIQRREDWRTHLDPVLQRLQMPISGDATVRDKLHALHGVLATIDPHQLPPTLTAEIEIICAGVNGEAQPVDPVALPTVAERCNGTYPAGGTTSVWVGDITQMGADVIVNAANSELLGCRIPNHACIDNAIHSAAGPRVRDDCAAIIALQGVPEPVGTAKITRAYALPAKYVLHTVGPQLRRGAQPTQAQSEQLENAYRSCLNVAASVDGIRTIAFCAISTGVFAYPKEQAAMVALTVVANWLSAHAGRFDRVVFNLYSEADAGVYEDLLNVWE